MTSLQETTDSSVLQEAIYAWGPDFQMDMAVEEVGEFLVALQHWKRGRVEKDAVCEEIADVLIVMQEMALVFGAETVDTFKRQKMERLRRRIDETFAAQKDGVAVISGYPKKT